MYHVFLTRAPVSPPSACVRLFTYVRVHSLKSHNMSACIHLCTTSYVHLRLCPCPYVCDCACACVYVHIINNLDTSARIISDVSGCVFHSRTFEMQYMSTRHYTVHNNMYISMIIPIHRDICTLGWTLVFLIVLLHQRSS